MCMFVVHTYIITHYTALVELFVPLRTQECSYSYKARSLVKLSSAPLRNMTLHAMAQAKMSAAKVQGFRKLGGHVDRSLGRFANLHYLYGLRSTLLCCVQSQGGWWALL